MKDIALRVQRVSPSLTLEITAKAKKMKEDGIAVVSFGAGEPDFNTPDYILRAGKEALDKGVTKYTPASGTIAIRKEIAKKLKYDNGLDYDFSQIVVSNGAKHALYNACMAIINKGDEVIIPAPYWLTYPELVKLADGVPVYIDADAKEGFKITPQQLKKAITKKTKAIIFNNPSNPTGAVYTKDEIIQLAKIIEDADIYVISDEIYEKLTYDDIEYYSIASYSKKLYENTIVVNGVSKSYSMTGWRIGYTACNATLAKAIASMQSHVTSNPNSIAQYATVVALESDEGEKFLRDMKKTFDERRKLISSLLSNAQIKYVYPQGAFYVMASVQETFGKTANGKVIKSASDFASALLESKAVATIPCESFGASGYVRLSYAISNDDITSGIQKMEQFIKELK